MLRSTTIPLLMGAIAWSGCGFVVSGSHTEVPVKSDPAGAVVVVDGVEIGRTPLRLSLRASEQHLVEVRANGYATRVYVLEPRVEAAYVIFDVFTLVGLIIDPLTGGWYHLHPYELDAELPGTGRSAVPMATPRAEPGHESGGGLTAPTSS